MTHPSILFLDHAGVLGGAELYLLDVAQHYRDAATVLLFEDGPFHNQLESEGIPTEIIPAPPSFLSVQKEAGPFDAIGALPGVAALVRAVAQRAQHHDVVFANSQKSLIVGALAAWWTGRPFIWNLHDILTADHFSAINRSVAVRCANAFAHCVIVNSQATRKAFVKSGGDVSHCEIVYNGIDPDRFHSPSPEYLQSVRSNLGFDRDTPTVGVFSRLAPWKGQHILIHALSDLPDVHALLVGDALFEGDDVYAQSLSEQAARQGVEDRVHFLGFRNDVPALMHLVDVVAHTSVSPEPFGRVIVEGMLARTPVIAARAGGAREIIETGQSGYLVEPDDPIALADAIRVLFDNPSHTTSIVETARARALARFSREAMLSRMDEVILPFISSAVS